jgi:hypothetical protein
MKIICNLFNTQVSSKDMRIVAFIGILCLIGANTFAQNSPALDPNYMILQPKETFKGERVNSGVGGIIDNVGIMSVASEYGDVFLNSVDTLGYGGSVSTAHPLGLFQGGVKFSLFNGAKFNLDNVSKVVKVYFHEKDSLPLLIENGSYFRIRYPLKHMEYWFRENEFRHSRGCCYACQTK